MKKNGKIQKVEGQIILEGLTFDRLIAKNVISNNKTSGKITLPKELIGKKVYVVWEE